jgi:hypothetical protein
VRVASIVEVPDLVWLAAIKTTLVAGLGLMLASTSDGGAVSLTLYDGDERRRSYASSPEELVAALEAVRDQSTAHGL